MFLKAISCVFIIVGLASCGGGGGGDSSPALPAPSVGGKPNVSIDAFTIASRSDTNTADDATEINANINGGAFDMDWSISIDEPAYNTDHYTMSIFLSEDDALSVTDDYYVGKMVCGTVPGALCAKEGAVKCTFSTTNSFDCFVAGTLVFSNDITFSLDTLPKTLNVILQACNLAGTETICREQTQQVTFL